MHSTAPHHALVISRDDGDDPHAPLAIDLTGLPLPAFDQAPAPAEASTDLGFEFERAPRRRLGLFATCKAWYLNWLLRTLRAEHKRIEATLTETTHTVIAMTRRGQVSPWWPARRRELQERRAIVEARISEVVGDLVKLGALR